jgi:glucose-6-phosphate isomerase
VSIHFDEKNLLASHVGEANGVSSAEINGATASALEALSSFKKSSEQGRYGFPQLPLQTATVRSIADYARDLRGGHDTVCVVGIGGSALGAWALDCAMHGPHPIQSKNHPRLVVLDNVDPVFTGCALDSMNPKKTHVVVIAKSGSTAETIATFLIVQDWMTAKLGKKATQRISVVTSEGHGDLK